METQQESIDLRIGRDHLVKKVESSLMRVTPKDAGEMLAGCRYERQRNVRPRWVATMAEMMRRGEFYEGTSLKFAEVAGQEDEWILLDGQHRLHAVVASGVTCAFTITVCHVRTVEDAWKIYYTTDTGLSRGLSDLVPEIRALTGATTTMQANALMAACRIIGTGFVRAPATYEDRSRDWVLEQVRKWSTTAQLWGRILNETPNPDHAAKMGLIRSVVVAVALPTLHWQPERATAFWTRALVNDALRRTDPARALVTYLQKTAASGGYINAQCRMIAGAWNAEFTNTPHDRLSIKTQGTLAVSIAGTPYRRMGVHGDQGVPTDLEFTTRKLAVTAKGGRRNGTNGNGHAED